MNDHAIKRFFERAENKTLSLREIISFHISGSGNQIGNSFWSSFDSECNDRTNYRPGSFFEESKDGLFSPRALFLTHKKLRQKESNQIFCSKAKSFFESYGNKNEELGTEIQEKLRKEAEKCSCLEGFLITRSVRGYNASGLGSHLLELLSEYDKTVKLDFRLYPDHSDPSLEPEDAFNSALATHYALNANTDLSICLDSGALSRICSQNLYIKSPSFDDVCDLSAYLLESLTLPMRQKGPINGGLKDMVNNLVPFPRLNHIIPAIAPILSQNIKNIQQDTTALTSSLFSSQSQLIDCGDLKNQTYKHLACYMSYQGKDFDLAEIDDSINKLSKNLSFADFSPAKFKVCLNEQSPQSTKKIFNNQSSILGLINSTMISNVFASLKSKADTFVKSDHFQTKYSNNDSAARESIENLGYLIEDYNAYSNDNLDPDF